MLSETFSVIFKHRASISISFMLTLLWKLSGFVLRMTKEKRKVQRIIQLVFLRQI